MTKIPLKNNEHRPIVRIGDTIHRPTHWWTSSVHDLLNYLEKVGFAYSPRVLGFDDEGQEVLTYIEGESGKEGWYKIHSDVGLANFAKLLKSYHEAIAGYRPRNDATWAYSPNQLKPGEIMCHGDFGPWNIAWDGDKPVGILDWDFVLPAKPEHDIFYALEYSAPFRDDETTLSWHHFTEVPDRKRRVSVFLDAYGTNLPNIVDGVVDVQRQGIVHVQYLADRGLQPQIDWAKDGTLENAEKQAQWAENNRSLFE
jgi:hypothetical protein